MFLIPFYTIAILTYEDFIHLIPDVRRHSGLVPCIPRGMSNPYYMVESSIYKWLKVLGLIAHEDIDYPCMVAGQISE